MQTKQFQKNVENFICEKCGAQVQGSGYTNHCPKCLWSKHVDVYPGDREAGCGGLMEPVDIEVEEGQQILVHKCTVCEHLRRNKVQPEDDETSILGLAERIANKKSETSPF